MNQGIHLKKIIVQTKTRVVSRCDISCYEPGKQEGGPVQGTFGLSDVSGIRPYDQGTIPI